MQTKGISHRGTELQRVFDRICRIDRICFRRCGILPRCFAMARASPIGIASGAAPPHEAKLPGDPIPAAPCKQRKSHTEAPRHREFFRQDLQDGWDFSEVRHLAALLCDGPGKPDWHCVRCGAPPTKQSFPGTPSPPRHANKRMFPAETQETQRECPTGFAGWTGLGFRRQEHRKSKDFRTFRRGCHGDEGCRLTPWIQILRATGQNETLKPMESRLRRTLKR